MSRSISPSPALDFALYRILGNSLPPRHGATEMLEHLRFTLDHEPELRGCRKYWVLNRIADKEVEFQCTTWIRKAGHEYLRLPFDMEAYASCFNDLSDLPEGVERIDPSHSGFAFDMSSFALEWKYRYKNLQALGLNAARNAALNAGRAIARWTLPWDGGCFITAEAWERIYQLAERDPAALHLIVPLARIAPDDLLRQRGTPLAQDEPQIGFRNDSRTLFDERLRYGNRNKAALLCSLGVPGPWHSWSSAPWDEQQAPLSPERGRFVQGAWVARLTSKADVADNVRQRWRARFEGVERLCRRLDERLVAARNPPGRLLCYHEEALQRDCEHPLAMELVQRARAALGRPVPSVRNKTGCAVSGDPADYFSLAPYCYVGSTGEVEYRDGQRNPATAGPANDRAALDQLVVDTCTIALAGTISGDRMLLDHAARLIRTWFIDPQTRMNPNMRFAQVAPGAEQAGKNWGIVDFRGFWPLLDAITLTARTGALNAAEQLAVKNWFALFLDDVTSRQIDAPNNIAVWHDLVVAALAAFVGRHARAAQVLSDLPLRFTSQLGAFGVPVQELKRTRPLHYGLFLAHGLINVASLGRRLGIDLWSYSGSQHRSIAMLVRFLAMNKQLLSDYAADAERFDQRILRACTMIPTDAIHAQTLTEFRRECAALDIGDMSEGTMPLQRIFNGGWPTR